MPKPTSEKKSPTRITVPAYFNDAQRQATKDAGKIAGLNVLRIINEPTAAALAYGLDKDRADQTILVFDLGGGTFDVSVLEVGDGVSRSGPLTATPTLAATTSTTRSSIAWPRSSRSEQGIDLRGERMALQRPKRGGGESQDRAVGERCTTQINLPFITASAEGQPKHLTPSSHARNSKSWSQTWSKARQDRRSRRSSDAELTPTNIDDVILVGGTTRMPAVQAGQGDHRQGAEQASVNPTRSCGRRGDPGRRAQGEVQGRVATRRPRCRSVSRRKGGVITPLIERNTTIPTRRAEVFSTADGQPAVGRMHVLARRTRWRPTTRRSGSSSSSGSRRRRAGCRRSRSRSTSTRTGSSTSRRRTTPPATSSRSGSKAAPA